MYKPGSSINCGAPLCCRSDSLNQSTNSPKVTSNRESLTTFSGQKSSDQWQGTESINLEPLPVMRSSETDDEEVTLAARNIMDGNHGENGAGSWGELEGFCDSPLRTALSVLEHINGRFSRHTSSFLDGTLHEPNVLDASVNDARRRSSHHNHREGGSHEWEANDGEPKLTVDDPRGMNSHNDNGYTTRGIVENGQEGNGTRTNCHGRRRHHQRQREHKARHHNKHGRRHHDEDPLDYILWTGDITPHDVWKSDMAELIRVVRIWSQAMIANLPKDVPVFPVMGNHDTIPVNQ